MMYNPHNNDSIFKDFLFNLLLVFIILLALLLMLPKKPSESEQDITTKAEFVIQMEWDSERNIDVDIWVKDSNNNIVYFSGKKAMNMTLEQDDLGHSSDKYVKQDGTQGIFKINEEPVSIRGIVPGTYTVNAHIYNDIGGLSESDPLLVNVRVIKLNPYFKIFKGTRTFTSRSEEQTFISFTIDESGEVIDKDFEYNEITHYRKRAREFRENFGNSADQMQKMLDNTRGLN